MLTFSAMKEAMIKEEQLIMGNDVYDMVLRHKGKYVVSSIWIYKKKCTKQGLWFSSERIDYDMTYSIDQYISSIEPLVQNEEGRWYSASGGVTIEYIWVWHGTTWWTASWWIKILPIVKWVPTFKVECRIRGYVDDLKGWTHGRSNDGRIPKSCLGYSTLTRKKECGIFQVNLHDKIWCWWKEDSLRERELIMKRPFL